MEPDDYERWGLWWRRTVRGAAVATAVLLVAAVGYLLAALLALPA
jgi:hypothetical protein